MRNKIITSFFCLLLAVSALIGLLMPDRYYSEREKRTLTQKPKFTVANFISGEFSDELEKYLTDQVPLRDGWVTMKTYMELAIGKRESVGVYICKDKYLMDKFTSYSKKQLVANAAALVDLQEKLAAEDLVKLLSECFVKEKVNRYIPISLKVNFKMLRYSSVHHLPACLRKQIIVLRKTLNTGIIQMCLMRFGFSLM